MRLLRGAFFNDSLTSIPAVAQLASENNDAGTASIQHFGDSSSTSGWPADQMFSIVRLRSVSAIGEHVVRAQNQSAIVISTSLLPVARGHFQVWTNGEAQQAPAMPLMSTTLINMELDSGYSVAEPFDFLQYILSRSGLNDIAMSAGMQPTKGYRLALAENDLFTAQLTKVVLSAVDNGRLPDLEHIRSLLSAHVLQR